MSFYSEFEEHHAIVIHIGSFNIHAGFSGDDTPYYVDSTVIFKENGKRCFVGNEALQRATPGSLIYPVSKGLIQDMESMEDIWSHVFYSALKVDPSNFPVLLTEPPLCPAPVRERTIKIMFETFNVLGYYVACHSVLSLYSNGTTMGIVVDAGHEVSVVTPIHEGYVIPHAVNMVMVGGNHVTEKLEEVLTSRGYQFKTKVEKQILTHLKESCCFVASDKERCKIFHGTSYSLPNGRIIYLGDEVLKTTEVFFEDNSKRKSLTTTCNKSIQACDYDILHELYNNIYLAGGSSLFEGFGLRFEKELREFTSQAKVKNKKRVFGGYCSWFGGSVVSSISTFQDMYISRDEYDEAGPSIVSQKCV